MGNGGAGFKRIWLNHPAFRVANEIHEPGRGAQPASRTMRGSQRNIDASPLSRIGRAQLPRRSPEREPSPQQSPHLAPDRVASSQVRFFRSPRTSPVRVQPSVRRALACISSISKRKYYHGGSGQKVVRSSLVGVPGGRIVKAATCRLRARDQALSSRS